ncbi:hypothetical protein Tco_0959560 [Tanacetum coccineum]
MKSFRYVDFLDVGLFVLGVLMHYWVVPMLLLENFGCGCCRISWSEMLAGDAGRNNFDDDFNSDSFSDTSSRVEHNALIVLVKNAGTRLQTKERRATQYVESNQMLYQNNSKIELVQLSFTTTIGSIPGELSGLSLATCRWGYVSLATCRWGIIAGETSSGIQSPAIIPSEEVGPTHFSVKEVVPRWHKFPRRQVAGESSG